MSDSNAETLVLRPDVVATVIEEGAVLLDLETKFFYTVNHSGWAILQLFESGTTPHEVERQCVKWGAQAGDADSISKFLALVIDDHLVTPTEYPASDPGIEFPHNWSPPTVEKSREPLQRIMKSPFDPTLPLAE